jgi:hypothetical protein
MPTPVPVWCGDVQAGFNQLIGLWARYRDDAYANERGILLA